MGFDINQLMAMLQGMQGRGGMQQPGQQPAMGLQQGMGQQPNMGLQQDMPHGDVMQSLMGMLRPNSGTEGRAYPGGSQTFNERTGYRQPMPPTMPGIQQRSPDQMMRPGMPGGRPGPTPMGGPIPMGGGMQSLAHISRMGLRSI